MEITALNGDSRKDSALTPSKDLRILFTEFFFRGPYLNEVLPFQIRFGAARAHASDY